jgi:hypothetical protein
MAHTIPTAIDISPRLPLRAEGAAACLLPWVVATLFDDSPALSWWIAWLGSWFIIWLVFKGWVFHLPTDRPRLDQVLRPWFLMHLVFASYNFLTAIFFWFDVNEVTFGLARPTTTLVADRALAAEAQRFYVLGHAGLVVGLGLVRQLPKEIRVIPSAQSFAKLLLVISLGAAMLAWVFSSIPGLGQFEVKMQGLFSVSSAVCLGVAFQERSELRPIVLILNLIVFFAVLTSGWKGAPIVMIILIAAAFYPAAPKRTVLASGIVLLIGAIVLPSVSNFIRGTVWQGEMTKLQAAEMALEELSTKSREDIFQDSWTFLAGRLSEAALFVKYIEQVPAVYPYYGTALLSQAATAVIPRIIWPDKRNLEEIVNERVVGLEIIERGSEVSAKPQYIVDGFLVGGAAGVFGAMLVYGMVAQLASNFCAKWLGGYFLGGVGFNGLFAILWQGSAFEFVSNAVLWSFIAVYVLFFLGRWTGVLRR